MPSQTGNRKVTLLIEPTINTANVGPQARQVADTMRREMANAERSQNAATTGYSRSTGRGDPASAGAYTGAPQQSQTWQSAQRALMGVHDLARGVLVMTSGNEALEKLLTNLVKLESIAWTMRGVTNIFAGVGGAIRGMSGAMGLAGGANAGAGMMAGAGVVGTGAASAPVGLMGAMAGTGAAGALGVGAAAGAALGAGALAIAVLADPAFTAALAHMLPAVRASEAGVHRAEARLTGGRTLFGATGYHASDLEEMATPEFAARERTRRSLAALDRDAYGPGGLMGTEDRLRASGGAMMRRMAFGGIEERNRDAMSALGRGDATAATFADFSRTSRHLAVAGMESVDRRDPSLAGALAGARATTTEASDSATALDSRYTALTTRMARQREASRHLAEMDAAGTELSSLAGVGPTARRLELLHARGSSGGRSRADWERMASEGGRVDPTELDRVTDDRAEAHRRLLAAPQQELQIQQQIRQANVQNLTTERERWQGISRSLTDQAQGLRDQQRSTAGSFGLMDVSQQQRALDIGQRLARGDTNLSREEIDFARGVEPLQAMINSLGSQLSGQNGILNQIEQLSRPGEMSRQGRINSLTQAASEASATAMRFEQALNVQISQQPAAVAREIATAIAPALAATRTAITDALTAELRRTMATSMFGTIFGVGAGTPT